MAQEMKKLANKVIAYAFVAGVVIALVLGLISAWVTAWVPLLTTLMILMGIIVGFFNITPAEAKDYVLFVTAMVVVIYMGQNNLGSILWVGKYITSVLASIMAFIMPSAIIVGIRAIINLARG